MSLRVKQLVPFKLAKKAAPPGADSGDGSLDVIVSLLALVAILYYLYKEMWQKEVLFETLVQVPWQMYPQDAQYEAYILALNSAQIFASTVLKKKKDPDFTLVAWEEQMVLDETSQAYTLRVFAVFSIS